MRVFLLFFCLILVEGCSGGAPDSTTQKTFSAIARYNGIVNTLSGSEEYCGVRRLKSLMSTYASVQRILDSWVSSKINEARVSSLRQGVNFDESAYYSIAKYEKIEKEAENSLRKYKGLPKSDPECELFIRAISTIDEPYFHYGTGYVRTVDFSPNYDLIKKKDLDLLVAAVIEQKSKGKEERRRSH